MKNDMAFNELIEKGFLEANGKDASGELQYRLTAKAQTALEWKKIADQTDAMLKRATALSN